MRIVKLILYILLGSALAWFAARNWFPVRLQLWASYEMIIQLPVLIFAALLLGALPGALIHSTSRMRWRRRLARSERRLAEVQTVPAEPETQPISLPPAGA